MWLAILLVSLSIPTSLAASTPTELGATVAGYTALVTDCGGDLQLLRQRTEEMKALLAQTNSDPGVLREGYVALAKVHFLYGEMGTNKSDRIRDYQQCAQYAKRALDFDDKSYEAYFWNFSGLAREAEIKGILKAVTTGVAFKVKGQITRAYELNSHDAYVLSGLGSYYWKAPRLIGGSKDKAREYLEEAMRLDPRLSFARVTLAKVLIDMNLKREAKQRLEEVLALQQPSDPNFYQFVNKTDAEQQLERVKKVQ